MGLNLPTYELNGTLVTARIAETPDADWVGGMNQGGSNAPGVGINTGNFDPKVEDWPRIADVAARPSQHLGQAGFVIQVVQGADINDNVAFVTNALETAPDAILDIPTGAVNKTGLTVPALSWTWGVIPVA